MSRLTLRPTPEIAVLTALLVLSLLGLVFMNALVAQPKLLFGRSLSALAPSLFPTIIFVALAALCTLLLVLLNRQGGHDSAPETGVGDWRRGVVFFGIMTLYALTMQPFGFLISSAISTTLLSWQMGNRSVIQTALLAVGGPILLYLAATRLLAVSLPELSVIEFAYARLLGG